MEARDLIEQALERTGGSRVLAELLVKTVAKFITPIDDPLYDWQIKKLTEVNDEVRQVSPDGIVWRQIPETVSCRQFVAPIRQCALAWGHRMVPGNNVPTPVAVLVWAARNPDGTLSPVLGTQFFVRNANNLQSFDPNTVQGSGSQFLRWFTTDTSTDIKVIDAVLNFLNNCIANTGGTVAGEMKGVDLDEEPEETL